MSPQLWWYVARAGGLVAYGLLAASILWGLAVSTRLLGRWPAPGWTLDLHRYLGGLALSFSGIHLAALLLDSYIQFDLLDLLVPFASTWRPGALGHGFCSFGGSGRHHGYSSRTLARCATSLRASQMRSSLIAVPRPSAGSCC